MTRESFLTTMELRTFIRSSQTIFVHAVEILYARIERVEAALALPFSQQLFRLRCLIVVCRIRYPHADSRSQRVVDMLALI